ncbi:MAG: family 65 glycosyl hydrolase [Candidatus Izimaplasma sp.]|nr:family 65 glycosyl hydrolase [Candidatus Izimaplasma bacterium]
MKLIRNNRTSANELFVDESIFAVQNKMIGVRGSFAEGYQKTFNTNRGTYINGVYDTFPYEYGEKGYGFPDEGQIIVNLPDGQTIKVYVNDTPVDMNYAKLIQLKRTFDLENGFTLRIATYELDDGTLIELIEKRMASLEQSEVVILDFEIKSINYAGPLRIVSTLDASVSNYFEKSDPRIASHYKPLYHVRNTWQNAFEVATNFTDKHVVAMMDHSINFEYTTTDNIIAAQKEVTINQGDSFQFKKYLVYTSDEYHVDLLNQAETILKNIKQKDVYQLQKKHLKDKMIAQTIEIYGNDQVNVAVNYNLYQLYTSGGRDVSHQIPAKGLTGEGYEGHYFWDTEMYMLPYFLLTDIKAAYNLLMYRYNTLHQAKQEARKLGHNVGAKYPWRTINGEEVSPYYPAGTAQYHINSIIAYSFISYYKVTNDRAFMHQYGFEVLYETALIFLQIGTYVDGAFHITKITGPDEYTALVDDNYYTNKMAQYHMQFVVEFFKEEGAHLTLDVDQTYIDEMAKAESNMLIPFDKKENIHLQDDKFLYRQDVDVKSLKRPLLLHYHPLTIYRMRAIKQADVALAYMLLDDEKKDVMQRSVDFYESYTTHDSSLSKCIYAIMYARLGNQEMSTQYFNEQWAIDFDNTLHNTQYGLHVANLGGSFLTILYGFLGLRIHKQYLELSPFLPTDWKGYKVSFNYQNRRIIVEVGNDITIHTTKEITIKLYGKIRSIKDLKIVTVH